MTDGNAKDPAQAGDRHSSRSSNGADWAALRVRAPLDVLAQIEDDVVPVLEDAGFLGASRETWIDPAYAAARESAAPQEGETRESLCVYLERGTDPERAAETLVQALDARFGSDAVAAGRIRVEPVAIPDQDWATQWKEFFRPIRVSPRLLVLPAWWEAPRPFEQPDRSDQSDRTDPSDHSYSSTQPAPIVLRIEPGRAFGSGTHATTQLSLRLLERAVRRGDRVLDFGAGSGILSFAARALGARTVVAVEVDEECLENFHENARINSMEDTIDYRIGSSERLGEADRTDPSDRSDSFENGGGARRRDRAEIFDVIVCNVLFERVKDHLAALAQRLAPGGRFIVSGFLAAESETVSAHLESLGLIVAKRENLEEWQAIAAQRRD